MTNPVSNIPSAQLPVPSTQLVETDGSPTPLFHRFLTGLYLRTGGANGVNSSESLTVAQAAQATATAAQTAANFADSTATTALTEANTALSAANTALTLATSAAGGVSNLNAQALLRAANLADLNSQPTARANLGVAIVPITLTFDGLTSGLTRYIPIVQGLTVPLNFVGSGFWCGTVPTSDAVFTVSYLRGGVATAIGSITVTHATRAASFSGVSAQLVSSDILSVQCPLAADATLANVGLTLALTVT